eukprot:SAG25_NODE_4942_length_727_cov_0.820064_2_plen_25_part_01
MMTSTNTGVLTDINTISALSYNSNC